MEVLSLYDSCLQKVSHFLNEGALTGNREDNPFKGLPSNIIRDLYTSQMNFQNPETRESFTELGLRGLEHLMESETLPELKLQGRNVSTYFPRLLVSLASGCRNLEIIKLTNLRGWGGPGISQALENVLRNSFNLKLINCVIRFDLKALRNCRKLESVILGFTPVQPWYDFLDENDGCRQNLDSLVLFTIKWLPSEALLNPENPNYVSTILKHCPNLASLGDLDSTRALAQLHQAGSLHHVNLRYCAWSDITYTAVNIEPGIYADTNDFFERQSNPELIQRAVIYHSLMKELLLEVSSIESIPYLSNLRNLTFFYIQIYVENDYSLRLSNVFKDIGQKLKYVGFCFNTSMDFTQLLQHSPNIEALKIVVKPYIERLETDINLPKLKYLNLLFFDNNLQVLTLFSNCHNLIELFLNGDIFDDRALDEFLRKNSIFKLKIAGLTNCQLSQKGVRKFLLGAPELQYFVTYNILLKRRVKAALRETNHNAKCISPSLLTREFFVRWFSKYN